MRPHAAPATWGYAASDATAAIAPRDAFMRHLRANAPEDSDFDAARLIYTELVANVIRHAPGPIWITLGWTRNRKARLRVYDAGEIFEPSFALPADRFARDGRGLHIVASLAGNVTVVGVRGGVAVNVVLPIAAA
jgi:anti-sigma regulatory factor (Ser/Thr protein kinase)